MNEVQWGGSIGTAESGGVPIIDVEGYVDGELIGGIELQFESEIVYHTLLPLIHKQ